MTKLELNQDLIIWVKAKADGPKVNCRVVKETAKAYGLKSALGPISWWPKKALVSMGRTDNTLDHLPVYGIARWAYMRGIGSGLIADNSYTDRGADEVATRFKEKLQAEK